MIKAVIYPSEVMGNQDLHKILAMERGGKGRASDSKKNSSCRTSKEFECQGNGGDCWLYMKELTEQESLAKITDEKLPPNFLVGKSDILKL